LLREFFHESSQCLGPGVAGQDVGSQMRQPRAFVLRPAACYRYGGDAEASNGPPEQGQGPASIRGAQ
jgi:hypothetical protein